MRKLLAYVAAAFCLLQVMYCSMTQVAGGSDNPDFRVSGTLVDSLGNPASYAQVKLVPADYDPVLGKASSSIRLDTTDECGRYCVTTQSKGAYTILAIDISQRTRSIVQGVVVSDTMTFVRTDTLRSPGSIRVILPQISTSPPTFVFISGTDIFVQASPSSGFALLDSVPTGTISLVCSVEPSNPESLEILAENVVVVSNGSTLVGKVGWSFSRSLYLNTTTSGAGVSGTVLDFPVLVKLTQDNFNFGEAQTDGSDIRFAKVDGSSLSYEIEQWDASLGSAAIWVRVDTIFGNDSSHFINMYWGNQNATSASNSAAVFDTANGFQGVWHMNELNGLVAQDATENHYDGTPSDTAPSSGTGEIGIAQQFNGVSSSLQMNGTAGGKLNFSEDASFTVSAWVYVDTLIDSMTRMIVGKGPRQYYMKLFSSGLQKQWEFSEFVDNIGYQILAYIPAVARSWKYLVGVRDGTNQYLYLDGTLINSTISTLLATGTRDTTNDVTIGRYLPYVTESNQGYAFFDGEIDEVRISNVSRSADWIKLCYMNQKEQDALLHY